MNKYITFGIVAALMLGVTSIFIFKGSKVANTDQSQVVFKFESFIPKTIGMGAVTLCQTVTFKERREDLYPWRYESHRQYIKHELIHVAQCEAVGHVDYYLGYFGNSFWQGIRHGFKNIYLWNSQEKEAQGNQWMAFTDREMQIVLRYWPK